MNMKHTPKRGPKDRSDLFEGLVEILTHKKLPDGAKQLLDYQRVKNLVLFQGNAEIIRTLSSISPSTKPRVITRMCVGDQGTIPSDSTVPKVPIKTASSLYHEIYRKDIDSRTQTLYSPTGFTYTGNTTISNDVISGLSSIVGVVVGQVITGTGIQLGAVVTEIISSSSVRMSIVASSSNTGVNITFSGSINECQFSATFDATDVPLTAFANPSQPRINEVGLVIIDPTAAGGLVRVPVASPNAVDADEVLMTIRTFKSVPFEVANDISITIRYTIFTE
jgi:hypothetical protein